MKTANQKPTQPTHFKVDSVVKYLRGKHFNIAASCFAYDFSGRETCDHQETINWFKSYFPHAYKEFRQMETEVTQYMPIHNLD